MEESWKIELIIEYINVVENHKKGEGFIHLIISQEGEGNLINKLTNKINFNTKRNKRQIVEANLKVIDISIN